MRTPGADRRPLLLDPDNRRVAAVALERLGLDSTLPGRRSVQRELSRALNGRLGPLRAIYRRVSARPRTKPVLTRQDEPLPASEVAAIIEAAVGAHNGAAPTPPPAFDLARTD